MPLTRTERWLLWALLVLNAVLKCCWLGVNELAHDEPFTVYWSQRPLAELWTMLAAENNPPLYFLLIKTWTLFVPFEAEWLRVPSAVFSALTVWPLFLLARKLADARTAVVAALLFTLANYHFGFAHEVRAYSLFALLSTASMWMLFADNPRRMLWLTVFNVLLVYTHFFGWLLIGVQVLLVLLLPELRSGGRSLFIALGATVVTYIPYVFVFAQRLGQSVSEGTWLTAPTPEELYNMIWRWSNAPVLAVGFLTVILMACAKDRLHNVGLRLGLIWAFVPLLGMFVASFAVPMFLDRYLVYAAPGFALLVACSLAVVLPSGIKGHVLAVLPVAGMLFTFTPWKSNGLHPSNVVQVEDDWCEGSCSVQVLPPWYWTTHLAARNIRSLQRPSAQHLSTSAMERLSGNAQRPEGLRDTVPTVIVIDAGAHLVDPNRAWYHELRATHGRIDSVEADRKVWVYRFRR